jgi:DNA-binding NtrC family response regulator
MRKPTIVLVEGDETIRRNVQKLLLHHGWAVIVSLDTTAVLQTVHSISPDLVIVGSSEDGPWQGIELAQHLHRQDRKLPVILLPPYSSEELAIAALRAGVRDYFRPPFSLADVAASVQCCLADGFAQEPQSIPATTTVSLMNSPFITGKSQSIRQIKAYIEKIACTDSTVLITGETGTGKELVAALLHRNSPRHQKPFLCLNCAAIPDSLFESELFGYERGAFTGAHTTSAGVLQRAEGGTVFFDEIGEMSPYAQAKILRAIDCKEVQRLGGKRSIPLNIRLIAATNGDVEHLVSTGTFRKDLYFRLNVARIFLPPLRERKEDIPLLVAHYIREANHRFGREVEHLTDKAMTCLLRYEWPGNVRELKNLIEATFVSLPARHLSVIDLPELCYQQLRDAAPSPQDEQNQILSALCTTNWNKSKAAQQLHWSRMTLYRKMAKYHIVRGGRRGGSTDTTAHSTL